MLKGLKRQIFGEKFFGKIEGMRYFGGKWIRYKILGPNKSHFDIFEDVIEEKVYGHSLFDRIYDPFSIEGKEGIKIGGYVEVEFPGLFRQPKINPIPAYAELNPHAVKEGKIQNPYSRIAPVEFHRVSR